MIKLVGRGGILRKMGEDHEDFGGASRPRSLGSARPQKIKSVPLGVDRRNPNREVWESPSV